MSLFRPAVLLLLVFTVLLGLVYPGAITGVARIAFPVQSTGSLMRDGERVIGSSLIGQPFDDPAYFWGRPSATTPVPYNAAASAGSNLGPANPALHDAVAPRIAALRAADPGNQEPVPVDLVTASGSGLDPHISPAAAYFQVSRVARKRGLASERVRALVDRAIEGRTLGLIGEPRVNVLRLNLALDHVAPRDGEHPR
jgi:potassium-transporting ATPase KdpC subunit